MIPDEAVEAAARVLCGVTEDMWKDQPTRIKDKYRWEAIAALEAAAPHLLSHEREQTRLAHLDAMVNRETKQAELAAAWDEGYEQADYDAPHAIKSDNPYRKATDA